MLVWMCSAHVNQRSSKNCIIPLGVGAARGDYNRLGFLTQTGSRTISPVALVLTEADPHGEINMSSGWLVDWLVD